MVQLIQCSRIAISILSRLVQALLNWAHLKQSPRQDEDVRAGAREKQVSWKGELRAGAGVYEGHGRLILRGRVLGG